MIKSQDELTTAGSRQSDVLIEALKKCQELEAENKYLKSLLQQIRPHIGFNGYFSVSEQTRILDLINKIDEVVR